MSEALEGAPTSPHTLRGRSSAETRSAVLDLIRSSGKISRVDLARRSALTEATISKIVKELLAAGLVVQAGYAESTGGKRPALLKLNDSGVYALGLTIDYNRAAIVLCGPDGTELARKSLPGIGQDAPPVALERLAGDIGGLLRQEGIDRTAIIGLGVAMAGRRPGMRAWDLDASFYDVWEPYSIEGELAERTGLAVVGENDANCAALGEYWIGGEPERDFVTVYMSHGIGAGIIVNGAIYRGSSGNAGEIGHIESVPGGASCWCGSRGCLETVASPRAIVDTVLADAGLRRSAGIDERTPAADAYGLVTAAAREHEDLRRVVETAARHFAAAVGDLVNTLDLDLVVLAGSGFAGVEEVFLEAARERVRTTGFMRELHPITVRLASVESDTAAFGAASVVLHRHLTPHRSAPLA